MGGTKDFGHYRGVATKQGFYKCCFNGVGTKMSGHYYNRGVTIKRDSTVIIYTQIYSIAMSIAFTAETIIITNDPELL